MLEGVPAEPVELMEELEPEAECLDLLLLEEGKFDENGKFGELREMDLFDLMD